MDLSPPPPPPTTISTNTAAVKTPDAETETPTRIQSNNLSKHFPPPPLTNGVLKRHKHLHHQPPPPPVVVTYRECLKNHAATMGGHAVDGCGEFMQSPTSTPTHPTSLKCAACGCHRNFHRRDPDESSSPLHSNTHTPLQHVIEYQPHHRHHPPPPPRAAGSPPNSPSPPPISSSYYPSAPHMLLALSTGLSAPPVENHHQPPIGSNPHGKKRFRTKFTQNQKEKMQEFAERLGWKMQKRDEELILGFCAQIGVDKGVFKVWMHNNKINKKDFTNNHGELGSLGGGFDLFNLENGGNHHHAGDGNHQLHNNDSVSTGGNVNGSSSSS